MSGGGDRLDDLLREVAAAPEVRPIFPGAEIGHYRVLRRLGAGGMGEVWAAEDQRLRRQVALKRLPAAWADDPTRRARLEREAKVLAALSHPNIVTVHAVERDDDGRPFLVMELVAGRSVAARLEEGPLSLAELRSLAIALADALGAAHEHGVTHRDLKPHNLMLAGDGRLKVLDFGLARIDAAASDPGASAFTATASRERSILGTVAYMSPEQAEGRVVDHRSDIFSTGVVLFELATGRRPWGGRSDAAVISSILRDPAPDPRAFRRGLPAGFARIIARCLEKEPARRYQSAIDLRIDLEELRGEPSRQSRRRIAAVGLSVLLVAAAAAAAAIAGWTRVEKRRAAERAPSIVRLVRITRQAGMEDRASLSPDGTWVVYQAGAFGHERHLYRQRIVGEATMDLTRVSGKPDDDDTAPAISPDGEQIAFRSSRGGGGLFVMGATGESPRRISTEGFRPRWTPDGQTVLASTDSYEVPWSRNGDSQALAIEVSSGNVRHLKLGGDAADPVVSPDRRRVVYWGNRGGRRDLFTALIDGTGASALTSDDALDWAPVFTPDGSAVIWASDRGGSMNLWWLPLDGQGRPAATPRPVTLGAGVDLHSPSLSADGRSLVFTSGGSESGIERVRFDPVAARVLGAPERLGPGSWPCTNGQLVAVADMGAAESITLLEPTLGMRRRLVSSPGRNRHPSFSPDGRRLAFASNREGTTYDLWDIGVDGAGLRRLTRGRDLSSPLHSPNGKWMAAAAQQRDESFLLDLDASGAPMREIPIPPPVPGACFLPTSFSPDSRLLAGFTPNTSPPTIWICDVAVSPPRCRHRLDGGDWPRFLPDARRLVVTYAGGLSVIDLDGGDPRPLVEAGGIENPALSPDGSWLYYMRVQGESDLWFATLDTGAP